MDQNKVDGIKYDNSVIKSSSVILSAAKDLKASLVSSASPQNDVEGIYQRYLKAFKKGVYNYIKEESDPMTQEMVPRKYFSGGFQGSFARFSFETSKKMDSAEVAGLPSDAAQIVVNLDNSQLVQPNPAMKAQSRRKFFKTAAALGGAIAIGGALGYLYSALKPPSKMENLSLIDLFHDGKEVIGPEISEERAVINVTEGTYKTDEIQKGACVIALVIDQEGRLSVAHFSPSKEHDVNIQIKNFLGKISSASKVILIHRGTDLLTKVQGAFVSHFLNYPSGPVNINVHPDELVSSQSFFLVLEGKNKEWRVIIASDEDNPRSGAHEEYVIKEGQLKPVDKAMRAGLWIYYLNEAAKKWEFVKEKLFKSNKKIFSIHFYGTAGSQYFLKLPDFKSNNVHFDIAVPDTGSEEDFLRVLKNGPSKFSVSEFPKGQEGALELVKAIKKKFYKFEALPYDDEDAVTRLNHLMTNQRFQEKLGGALSRYQIRTKLEGYFSDKTPKMRGLVDYIENVIWPIIKPELSELNRRRFFQFSQNLRDRIAELERDQITAGEAKLFVQTVNISALKIPGKFSNPNPVRKGETVEGVITKLNQGPGFVIMEDRSNSTVLRTVIAFFHDMPVRGGPRFSFSELDSEHFGEKGIVPTREFKFGLRLEGEQYIPKSLDGLDEFIREKAGNRFEEKGKVQLETFLQSLKDKIAELDRAQIANPAMNAAQVVSDEELAAARVEIESISKTNWPLEPEMAQRALAALQKAADLGPQMFLQYMALMKAPLLPRRFASIQEEIKGTFPGYTVKPIMPGGNTKIAYKLQRGEEQFVTRGYWSNSGEAAIDYLLNESEADIVGKINNNCLTAEIYKIEGHPALDRVELVVPLREVLDRIREDVGLKPEEKIERITLIKTVFNDSLLNQFGESNTGFVVRKDTNGTRAAYIVLYDTGDVGKVIDKFTKSEPVRFEGDVFEWLKHYITEVNPDDTNLIRPAGKWGRDAAMKTAVQNESSPEGGIDLTPKRMKLEVDSDKSNVATPMDLKALENIAINGLYIKTIEIKPLNDLPELLGVSA